MLQMNGLQRAPHHGALSPMIGWANMLLFGAMTPGPGTAQLQSGIDVGMFHGLLEHLTVMAQILA